MKSLENPFRQVLLLPPGAVGSSQGDQYVVRPKQSDRIAEGAERLFVADLTGECCLGSMDSICERTVCSRSSASNRARSVFVANH